MKYLLNGTTRTMPPFTAIHAQNEAAVSYLDPVALQIAEAERAEARVEARAVGRAQPAPAAWRPPATTPAPAPWPRAARPINPVSHRRPPEPAASRPDLRRILPSVVLAAGVLVGEALPEIWWIQVPWPW